VSGSRASAALERMHLPERTELIGMSVRAADRWVAAELAEDVQDTTHFDTVRFPPPDWALETFAAAARDGTLAYTPYRGSLPVREAVAAALSKRIGGNIDPDREVLLSPGTQAGLFALLGGLVSPGDTVVLFDPDYLFNERILRFLGARVRHVPLIGDAGVGEPDLDVLRDELEAGASLVLFSHPNNPTGALYSDATIREIAALAAHYDAFAVVDELYARLLYEGRELPRLIDQPGMKERCAILTGPSKTESLSGYRVGVVIGPEDVVGHAEDVLSCMALRAPAYAQHLLTRWLVDDEEFVARRLHELAALRDHTVARLRETNHLTITPPPATAYLFLDVRHLDLPDPELAARLIRDARVSVSPGYQFGPRGVGHFRICYAREERNWDRTLSRISAVLTSAART
jgi:aspartate/methionine/tyrosine aminotransferase